MSLAQLSRSRQSVRRAFKALLPDPSAWALLFSNVWALGEVIWSDAPSASLLMSYWLQMLAIGFWTSVKLVIRTRLRALIWVPGFWMMYLPLAGIFGIIAAGLLDETARGTAWHATFSPSDYLLAALWFWLSHGLSFAMHFVGDRQALATPPILLLVRPLVRAWPMWIAALVGTGLAFALSAPALIVVVVAPVKTLLDLLGHAQEHQIPVVD